MYPKENMTVPAFVAAALVLAGFASMAATARAQPAARYSALLVDRSGNMPGASAASIDIVVTRWSTAAEQDRVMTTALEEGAKGLLELLREMPRAGSVAPVGGVGFSVPYATHTRGLDGIERVMLLTDRPITLAERWNSRRSLEYPFTLIELALQPSGEGTGRIIAAARLSADKFNRTLVVENLDTEPLQLHNVRLLR